MPQTIAEGRHNGVYASYNVFADPFSYPNIQSEYVAVAAGTDPSIKRYTLPGALLTQNSPYFKNALEGDFKEAHERVVELSAFSPQTFEIYLQWLYTGYCTLKAITDAISAWSIADYLGSPGLKNCAIEALYWHIDPFSGLTRMTIEPAMVLQAYRRSSRQSKLRKLFARFVYVKLQNTDKIKDEWSQELENLAGEFLKDLMDVQQKYMKLADRRGLDKNLRVPATLYEMPEGGLPNR
ncbi:MAG: hypothetical protein Q9165_003699 [Trypethelium subeluteriae]